MNNKDKISIIVPVYQVEEYITTMIESVLQQTYQNFELLLIDDGSSDNSGTIADTYAAQDDRIKVFHIENNGVAHARSVGLTHAQGEYIFFLDSDDFLSCRVLERLYSCSINDKADIVNCLFIKEYEKFKLPYYPQLGKKTYTTKEILKALMKNQRVKSYVWGKLCKKSLFDDLDLTSMRLFEDVSIIHHIFMKANKVIFYPYYGYHYRIRSNSLTSQMDYDKLLQMKNAFIFQQDEIMKIEPSIHEYVKGPLCMSDIMILSYLNQHMDKYDEVMETIDQYKMSEVSIILFCGFHLLHFWVRLKKKCKKF